MPDEIFELRSDLLASLLRFTQFFYKLRTGRDFLIVHPTGRENRYITLCRELTNAFKLKYNRLYINICPGSGKSEICRHFVAYCLAYYPDCKFLYVSFSEARAVESTAIIKDIIELPAYKRLFGVKIHPDFASKSNFKTTAGGQVVAFGSGGSITGGDAGLPGLDRFSGCLIIDDFHKPDEVISDTLRQAPINNYKNTLQYRPRSSKVPIIAIGQILHEQDIFNFFEKEDGHKWHSVVLQSRDPAGNILCPEIYPKEYLDELERTSPYDFAAQHQQKAQPAGGGIFKPEWFPILEKEPKILATFITGDTAETDKTYNDRTVFSFWGLYKIIQREVESDMYALHWLDCVELNVEPKDLEGEFWAFYRTCMSHQVKPGLIAIEKKSTGTTLLSVLKTVQGLEVHDIDRNNTIHKAVRFLKMQPYIAKGQISIPQYGKHKDMVLEHMRKITVNNSHRWDDIADTVADACQIALIDQVLIHKYITKPNQDNATASVIMAKSQQIAALRKQAFGERRFV